MPPKKKKKKGREFYQASEPLAMVARLFSRGMGKGVLLPLRWTRALR